MKQELRTMEEKQKLNPNEIMENGLTREQNEQINKQSEDFGNGVNIIVLIISLFCMFTALKGLL